MPTAKLVPADAPAIKAMHDAAVPVFNTFWPGGASEIALSTWQDIFIPLGGWKVTANNGTLRGFLLTPVRAVPVGPDANMSAEECFLWVAPTSLSNAVFASSTKELMSAWFQDLVNRGIPRWWGRNPPQFPARTEAWFQNCVTKTSMSVYVHHENDVDWRYAYMNPVDALAEIGSV